MAIQTINSNQGFDCILTLELINSNGTVPIKFTRGSQVNIFGKFSYKTDNSQWTEVNVAQPQNTITYTSSILQIGFDWDKLGNDHTTPHFDRAHNIKSIQISQREPLSGNIGSDFMKNFTYSCNNLESIDVPNTSNVTRVEGNFMSHYCVNNPLVTELIVPDLDNVTYIDEQFMSNYAQSNLGLVQLESPQLPNITEARASFMSSYANDSANLETITMPYLPNIVTASPHFMYQQFSRTSVKSIEAIEMPFLETVDTYFMSSIFNQSYELTSIPQFSFPSLKTASTYFMSSFAANSQKITSIAGFNFPALTNTGDNFMQQFAKSSYQLTDLGQPSFDVLESSGRFFLFEYASYCRALENLDMPSFPNITVAGSSFLKDYAYSCEALTELMVPDVSTITQAGNEFLMSYAQNCYSITELDAPDVSNITTVGTSFLSNFAINCYALESLGIPDTSNITMAGDFFMVYYSAYNRNLTELGQPDLSQVTYIGESAFSEYARGCEQLTSLDVPNLGTINGVGGFFMNSYAQYCTGLTHLDVPDTSNIEVVGRAFMSSYAYQCSGLVTLDVPNLSNLTNANNSLLSSYAQYCTSLTELDAPDLSGLTSAAQSLMASYAQDCYSLIRLGVPTINLISVGSGFLENYAIHCSALEELDVPDTSTITQCDNSFMKQYALYCGSLKTIQVPDTSNITSIGNGFLENYANSCTSLTELNVPDTSNITNAGSYFMYRYGAACPSVVKTGLPNLSSVVTTTIPYGFMDDYFYNQNKLEEVVLPDSQNIYADFSLNFNVPYSRHNNVIGLTNDIPLWEPLTTDYRTLANNGIVFLGNLIEGDLIFEYEDFDYVMTLTMSEESGTLPLNFKAGWYDVSPTQRKVVGVRMGESGEFQGSYMRPELIIEYTSSIIQIGLNWGEFNHSQYSPYIRGIEELIRVDFDVNNNLVGDTYDDFFSYFIEDCPNVVHVDVPDLPEVTMTGDGFMSHFASDCESLEYLGFPDLSSLEETGYYDALVNYSSNNPSLKTIDVKDLPSLVYCGSEFMSDFASYNTGLTELKVPEMPLLTHARYSFLRRYAQGCTNLTSLNVPSLENLVYCESGFMNYFADECVNLTELSVPDLSNVTYCEDNFMRSYAEGCTNLEKLSIPNLESLEVQDYEVPQFFQYSDYDDDYYGNSDADLPWGFLDNYAYDNDSLLEVLLPESQNVYTEYDIMLGVPYERRGIAVGIAEDVNIWIPLTNEGRTLDISNIVEVSDGKQPIGKVLVTFDSSETYEGNAITGTVSINLPVEEEDLYLLFLRTDTNETVEIIIPRGSQSQIFELQSREDDQYQQEAQHMQLQLLEYEGGLIQEIEQIWHNSYEDTNIIIDNDTETKLTIFAEQVYAGEDIVFVAELDNQPLTDVEITMYGFSMTIPQGQTYAEQSMENPIKEGSITSPEHITFQVVNIEGGGFERVDMDSWFVEVVVNPVIEVTLSAEDAVEGQPITVTAELQMHAQETHTIVLSNEAIITIEPDSINGSVTFANPFQDNVYVEEARSLEINVDYVNISDYAPRFSQNTLTILIRDEKGTTNNPGDENLGTPNHISLNQEDVVEGEQIVIVAISEHPQATDMGILLKTEYMDNTYSTNLVIPQGQSIGQAVLDNPKASDPYKNADELVFNAVEYAGGGFENPIIQHHVSVQVGDGLVTTTLQLTQLPQVEGEDIKIIGTVNNTPETDLTVVIDGEHSLVIPIGQFTGSKKIPNPVQNNVYEEDDRSITLPVTRVYGGNYVNLVYSEEIPVIIIDGPQGSLDEVRVNFVALDVYEGEDIRILAEIVGNNLPKTDVKITLNNGYVLTIPANTGYGEVLLPNPNTEDAFIDQSIEVFEVVSVQGGGYEKLVVPEEIQVNVLDTIDQTLIKLSADWTYQGEDVTIFATIKGDVPSENVVVTLNTGHSITIASDRNTGQVVIENPVQDSEYDAIHQVVITGTVDQNQGGYENLVLESNLILEVRGYPAPEIILPDGIKEFNGTIRLLE